MKEMSSALSETSDISKMQKKSQSETTSVSSVSSNSSNSSPVINKPINKLLLKYRSSTLTPFEQIRSISSNGIIRPFKSADSYVALLIVNSYEGTSFSLGEDTCNDGILCYEEFKSRGYVPYVYYDISTKEFKNILRSFLRGNFEHLIIYYTGHGMSTQDIGYTDEADGKDEWLVFRDGYVQDDYLGFIVKNFTRTKNLTFITDCCHSGTIYDIIPSNSICTFAAAYDNETAKQMLINKKGNGIFTYYLWKYYDQSDNNIEKLKELINSKISKYQQHCNVVGGDGKLLKVSEKLSKNDDE